MKFDELVADIKLRNEVVELVRREPQEILPPHILLVEDEDTGTVSYMTLLPDGHLGGVEDY